MAQMGRYCKAYPLARLREFSGWAENSQNTRRVKRQLDGVEVEAPRELTDNDHLYLQENYTVTDGVFLDEHIIYDRVSPEWVEFTREVLQFEVPADERAEMATEQAAETSARQ